MPTAQKRTAAPAKRTRTPKTPAQRAQEALYVAQRRVDKLTKERQQLKDQLADLEAALEEAEIRRRYLATNPDDLATRMWDGLGGHHMAIVELRVAERTEPAHDDDTDPSAKLRVVGMEFATDTQDDELLRQAQRNRYMSRTARDTLDDAATFRIDADPNVSFHKALASYLEDKGQLGGYKVETNLDLDGDLIVRVTHTKAPKPKRT